MEKEPGVGRNLYELRLDSHRCVGVLGFFPRCIRPSDCVHACATSVSRVSFPILEPCHLIKLIYETVERAHFLVPNIYFTTNCKINIVDKFKILF